MHDTILATMHIRELQAILAERRVAFKAMPMTSPARGALSRELVALEDEIERRQWEEDPQQ